MAGDVRRVEAGRVAHGQQLALLRPQAAERELEIDELHRVDRVGAFSADEGSRDVDDAAPPGPAGGLAGLVRRDRDEPAPNARRLAQRADPAPRDCST